MKNNTEILELILTSQALLLSGQIHAEKQRKGTNRIGGDYLSEAIREIHDHRPEVLALLADTHEI